MWKCKHCKESVEDDFEACWNCGYSKEGKPPYDSSLFEEAREEAAELGVEQLPSQIETGSGRRVVSRAPKEVEQRYPALRLISSIFYVLGWFYVILTIAGVIAGIGAIDDGYGPGIIIAALIAGTLSTIFCFAGSELIKLFCDIEENTRIAASRR